MSPNMNLTTMNETIESSSCVDATATKIGQTIALSLILPFSLVGNSLVVLIVYKTPTLRKPINYFIANMAISDLLYPIFWQPWFLSSLHAKSWLIGGQLGQALCKFVSFSGSVSTVVSTQNLILIAVDRFGAVVFPLRSPLIRSKLCPFFILATWIVAVAVNSPFFFANELVDSPEPNWCVTKWKKVFGDSSSYASFQLAYYILFIYIPVLLLAILYSIIFIKLKTQVHPGEQSTNNQQQRKRRNRNVLQMSIAIVVVFEICWLPHTTYVLIGRYSASSRHFSCGILIFQEVSNVMVHAYCAINPLICFLFSSHYRQALQRLIKCSGG